MVAVQLLQLFRLGNPPSALLQLARMSMYLGNESAESRGPPPRIVGGSVHFSLSCEQGSKIPVLNRQLGQQDDQVKPIDELCLRFGARATDLTAKGHRPENSEIGARELQKLMRISPLVRWHLKAKSRLVECSDEGPTPMKCMLCQPLLDREEPCPRRAHQPLEFVRPW